jgi:hypothetical protein
MLRGLQRCACRRHNRDLISVHWFAQRKINYALSTKKDTWFGQWESRVHGSGLTLEEAQINLLIHSA